MQFSLLPTDKKRSLYHLDITDLKKIWDEALLELSTKDPTKPQTYNLIVSTLMQLLGIKRGGGGGWAGDLLLLLENLR